MTVRETSVSAYHFIRDQGLLSMKRFEVYEALHHHGPATGMELLMAMNKKTRIDSQVRARLNELRGLGVVTERGTRKCAVTGMQVIEWGVTDQLPRRVKKDARAKCCFCGGTGFGP